jgi:hypothetical protein
LTATLLQGSGTPAVTAANDTGAWWWPAFEEALRPLVREGDTALIPGETVKNFMVLKALAGSPGHGRGLVAGDRALFQVGLANGKQAIVRAIYDDRIVHAITGGTLGGTALPNATWLKLGLPSASEAAMNAVVLATLKTGADGVTSANARGIFETADEGTTWEPLVRMGDVAPGFGGVATFSAFKDPVNSDELTDVAFIGTAKGGGVLATDNDGIWFRPHGGTLTLIAREGAQPPGAPAGAKWKSFSSVAMPGNLSGPIFTAMLQKGAGITPGPGGITSLDDFALYAADGAGVVREILRENQPLLGKTVKTFNVLKAVSGSAGATRAFNVDEIVVAQVTFTDGTTAVVRIQLPPPVIVN